MRRALIAGLRKKVIMRGLCFIIGGHEMIYGYCVFCGKPERKAVWR